MLDNLESNSSLIESEKWSGFFIPQNNSQIKKEDLLGYTLISKINEEYKTIGVILDVTNDGYLVYGSDIIKDIIQDSKKIIVKNISMEL